MHSDKLRFTNSFYNSFPRDNGKPTETRLTPNVLLSNAVCSRAKNPELLLASAETAALLGLEVSPEEFAQVFSGQRQTPGMALYATRYGGHQFGHWADQLGDGRATFLGEVENPAGDHFEIQLKGAGPTPYSRRADGLAVLRSSLREFLCSEAMHHLGIPTTRALCCVTTGESIIRDMFYDGHPEYEPGAITTRVAPSFLRFGHFQILAAHGENPLLEKLIRFTIEKYFPEHSFADLQSWFKEICRRTAHLMVEWQRVGFVHGVMNTDNMSILGLTIDYGPYGWIDNFDVNWTPNTTDREYRRYCFGAQPDIALWNLSRLAEGILPIAKDENELIKGLELYRTEFVAAYSQMMAHKLGLKTVLREDENLITELQTFVSNNAIDMTIFFRRLADVAQIEDFALLEDAHYGGAFSTQSASELKNWIVKYLPRRKIDFPNHQAARKFMNTRNPYFVLRNYLAQMALDELAEGRRNYMDDLFAASKTPYEENSKTKPFFGKRPDWALNRAGCSMLSCSS